jgi:hypothetical protein
MYEEVINYGKEESKGNEEESLWMQEDKGQEKEEVKFSFFKAPGEIRAF